MCWGLLCCEGQGMGMVCGSPEMVTKTGEYLEDNAVWRGLSVGAARFAQGFLLVYHSQNQDCLS